MKSLKSIFTGLTLMAVLSSPASAVCQLSGYAVRVATDTSATYMYFRPTQSSPYYYLGTAIDPGVSAAMYQAFKGKSKIFVQSNASACPPVGGAGEKFIGIVEIVGLGY